MAIFEQIQSRLLAADPKLLAQAEKVLAGLPIQKWARKIPALARTMDKEFDRLLSGMRDELKPYRDRLSLQQLPKHGLPRKELMKEMEELRRLEKDTWEEGRVSGGVYHGDEEHIAFLNQAYALNSQTNPLHADLWPRITKFESEIVSMTGRMLGVSGDNEVFGSVSQGGTDSILLAMKAYRDYYRDRGIKHPEMVAPVTAHPAFDKAAECFSIKLRRIPVGEDCRAKVSALKSVVNKNTIVIIGSAPAFPHGVIDPIEEMSTFAAKRSIGFHTDACLGGFFLPWVDQKRYQVPIFDFRLPGVTSISVDTHKYGFSNKGSSVILYRSAELRRAQYFTTANWPGGLYFSPTFLGSRPGGLIAQTWAALASTGEDGYRTAVARILATADDVKARIREIDELFILGDPLWVIALGSEKLNIYEVLEQMRQQGWSLNGLHKPASIHICLTLRHTMDGVADRFVRDLKASVCKAKASRKSAGEGVAPLYGLASAIPVRGVVDDVLKRYIDLLYEPSGLHTTRDP